MYFSARTIQTAFDKIATLKIDNKFWGLLIVLKNITSNRRISTSFGKLSLARFNKTAVQNDLQNLFSINCNAENFNQNVNIERGSVLFRNDFNSWISNDLLGNRKIGLSSFAILFFRNFNFTEEITSENLINRLKAVLNLSDRLIQLIFENDQNELTFENGKYQWPANFSVGQNSYAFDLQHKTFVLKPSNDLYSVIAGAGELSRGPFYQPLYSAQNNAILLFKDSFFSEDLFDDVSNLSQSIYYGAPGTGKSRKIDASIAEGGCGLNAIPQNRKFRTTFHPDYDYAQFVGSYKPVKKQSSVKSSVDPGYLTVQQLTRLFTGFKQQNPGYPVHKFGALYYRSLQGLSGNDKKYIVTEGQMTTTAMDTELSKGMAVGEYLNSMSMENTIAYEFVPQVFAKAYVAAWKNSLKNEITDAEKQVYLVIEEINRGNCAQIFGDIFQLLDRKDGHSEYPIDVDSDFAAYIRKELGDDFAAYKAQICSYCEDAVGAADVEDDKFCKIALPSNFNILATMNTSDQSLFPMDSAFKRRFDWEYVPIKYKKDASCGESWNADQFIIKIGDKNYPWLDFLQAVNKDIKSATQSEDKQMGEFFVKPKGNIIDLGMFKSKILFYLWDSVYKEETSRESVFHFPKVENSNDKVSFQSFFEGEERDQIKLIEMVFSKLKVNSITQNQDAPAAPANDATEAVAEATQNAAVENPEA